MISHPSSIAPAHSFTRPSSIFAPKSTSTETTVGFRPAPESSSVTRHVAGHVVTAHLQNLQGTRRGVFPEGAELATNAPGAEIAPPPRQTPDILEVPGNRGAAGNGSDGAGRSMAEHFLQQRRYARAMASGRILSWRTALKAWVLFQYS